MGGFDAHQRCTALTFTLLLIGFVLLDLARFGYPGLTVVAGYELMLCALSAWYIMAHLIFADVFGRDVLPVGKAWIWAKRASPAVRTEFPLPGSVWIAEVFEMLLLRNCALALLFATFGGVATAADDDSATPEEAITKVWSAARFLQDKGVSGFCRTQQQGWSVGVEGQLRVRLRLPPRPDGRASDASRPRRPADHADHRQQRQQYIFGELCKAAASALAAGSEYMWTRPGAAPCRASSPIR